MQANNLFEEEVSNLNGIIRFMTRYKMCHLRKEIDHNKDAIAPPLRPRQTQTKSIEISAQGIEGIGRGIYKPCGFKCDLAF